MSVVTDTIRKIISSLGDSTDAEAVRDAADSVRDSINLPDGGVGDFADAVIVAAVGDYLRRRAGNLYLDSYADRHGVTLPDRGATLAALEAGHVVGGEG